MLKNLKNEIGFLSVKKLVITLIQNSGAGIFICLLCYANCFGQSASWNSLALETQSYKLNNGIRVILQPDLNQKEVSVEFWIHTGTKDEKKGKFGFAHFFEHATPQGFTNDVSSMNKLRSFRTNSNAQTKKDYTRYYLQVQPQGLPLALKFIRQRLTADTSKISDAIIEQHRKNVLLEMARQDSFPLFSPRANTERALNTFGASHPYGHAAYGSVAENENFEISEIKDWYKTYFFSENITVFIVGNFNAAQVLEIVKKELSVVPQKNSSLRKRPQAIKTIGKSSTLSLPSGSHFLTLTWSAPGYNSKASSTLQLLAYILEERLQKRHLSINISGSLDLFESNELAGQFGLYAGFSSIADSNAVETFLQEALDDVLKKKVSANEIIDARRAIVEDLKTFQRKLGFIQSRTELLGEGLLFANDPLYYLKRIKIQSKLTSKDIQETASRYLQQKAGRVLIISNK